VSGTCCQNPLCETRIGEVSTGTWRRTPRRFCSDHCQRDVRALRRVAAMLLALGQATAWKILEELDKAEDRNEHKTKQTEMSNVRGVPHTKADLPAGVAD